MAVIETKLVRVANNFNERNAMTHKQIFFGETQMKEFAMFVSQLEREGVTYDVDSQVTGWTVTLTGGY